MTMLGDHDIQQAVNEEKDGEDAMKSKDREIHRAVDAKITDEVEREIRSSTADLHKENLSLINKYHPFRVLDQREKIKAEKVVLDWFKNRSNIERVAKQFDRKVAAEPRTHLLQWFVISIARMPKAGILKEGMSPDDKTNIVVWIALGKLGKENGMIPGVDMASGEDLSVDGSESITFSGIEGGLAVLLLLNM